MNIQNSILYAAKHISIRGRRSLLSIMGIVIGVIAIVIILSVSEGFNEDLNSQLTAFGPDMLMVLPAASVEAALGEGYARPPSIGKIFQEDVDDIDSIEGVKGTSRMMFERSSISFKSKNITAFIYAADKEIFDQYEDYLVVESGRIFKEGERNVAIFAADAATELFGKDKVEVGSVVRINSDTYRVVGILKRIGTSFSETDDRAIFIPFDDRDKVFHVQFLEDEVGYVNVQIEEGFDPDEIKEAIERELSANRRKRVDEKDFSVVTSDQVMRVVGNILFASQLVLGAITLIASVVGAIGISNTMYVNVLERVGEIGILKAMGATKKDILILFLTESAMIGLAGGVIGLILSYVGLQLLIEFFGVPVIITFEIIAFVSIFSFSTGIIAGIFPAYRAAKMTPVEAFRHA